jgi:hypothetical protein
MQLVMGGRGWIRIMDVQRRNDQSAEGRRGFATISAQGGKRPMTD